MNVRGVESVLNRLSKEGCGPRVEGADSWQARCPVHGGPYPALLITRGADGTATLKCRYMNYKGESCREADIWEALGLQPPPPPREAGGDASGAAAERGKEPNLQPSQTSPTTNTILLQESSGPASSRTLGSPISADGDESPGPPNSLSESVLSKEHPPLPHQSGAQNEVTAVAADLLEAPAGDPVTDPDAEGLSDLEDSLELAEALAEGAERPGRETRQRPEAAATRDRSHDATLKQLFKQVRVVRGLDHRLFAAIECEGHRELHELSSPAFRNWLNLWHRRRGLALPDRPHQLALIRAFEAEAAGVRAPEPVWVRVADGTKPPAGVSPAEVACNSKRSLLTANPDAGATIYVDLGDESWRSVAISPDGCRIVERAPVLFWRPKGFGALPEPRWGGSIDLLRKYINVRDTDYPLVKAWMTAAVLPVGPYPILVLTGEQGSAKSTMARVIRDLIDPIYAPLRGLPASERDFMIQARNAWVLVFDNVRRLSARLSDVFCRTATGGGFSTRTLHTNDDETFFDVERPTIITSIDDLMRHSDFTDRGLHLHLELISAFARRSEQAIWSEFERDRPLLLGSLFEAVALGLKMLPHVQLPALPRMADFALWGEAVTRGLGGAPGSFLELYNENRRMTCETALEDCPVADTLRELTALAFPNGPLEATATGLLRTLATYTSPSVTRSALWPKTPRSLSCTLRRIAPQLRTIGINVIFHRFENTRMITIAPYPE